ncbi:hypothetical protein D3C84_517520 [compost metagenome]
MDPSKFLIFAASFIVTVCFFVFLVRRASAERRIYWIVFCSVASIAWLGLVKGLVASVIAIAFTSGYVATRLDARRIGKRIADSMGIGHNLFFSSLEQTLPLYLTILASLEREGEGVVKARRVMLPYLLGGLDALEERFGRQPQIDAAREAVVPFLRELDEVAAKQ